MYRIELPHGSRLVHDGRWSKIVRDDGAVLRRIDDPDRLVTT